MEQFKEMDNKNETRNKELLDKIDGFVKGLSALKNRQKIMEEQNEILRHDVRRLQEDVRYLQSRESAANLVVHNLGPEIEGESEESLLNRLLIVFSEAKIENFRREDLLSARRVGARNPPRARTVIFKLSSPSLKKAIFPKAKFIREKFNISLTNDYSPSQREELFKLRSVRRQLKVHNIDATIRGFELLVNGNSYNCLSAERLIRSLDEDRRNKDTSIAMITEEGFESDSSQRSKRKAEGSPSIPAIERGAIKKDRFQRPERPKTRNAQQAKHINIPEFGGSLEDKI